ncbi:hypothetical protein J2Z32_002953 [Paenibacillus turicensis]|uniref:DUF4238 domain-containing protein n=1 Tax=Paenibacillus turicensis TaxID=160487 RepID=A0ABS4FUQ7_9BACL|nr:hypothetical protein [Paenibacillus turicensis]MBP1906304.1 hypothetical protein [Paenibacillus turicensis]
MDIEKLFIKGIKIDDRFSYKSLYNDDRGAVHKDSYKFLLSEAISKGIITVEKYLIAEDVREELFHINESSKGLQYTLVQCLKAYHNESDYIIAPLIYLLKRLDPDFTVVTNEKLEIRSDVIDAEISPRIDGKNATPRLFFPKENIAIAVTNDDIENLGDILAVKDAKVYILGTDDRSNIIYAYKVNRASEFFEVAEGYKERAIMKLLNKVRENEI